MSAQYDDYEDYDSDDDEREQRGRENGNPLRKELRRLEKQVKELRQQAEDGQKATRQLEFVKAGVDLNNPMASYFVNGYQGDLTPEAIKAEAAKLGLVASTEQPQEQGIPAEEQAAHQRIADATAGANAPGQRDFDAEMRAAKTVDEHDRIYQEKHATLGLPGVPAIVND